MSKMFDRERFRSLLKAKDIDVLIASSPENTIYMSGYCPAHPDQTPHTAFVVVPREDEPTLVVPKSTEGMIQAQEPWIKDVRYFGDFFVEGVTASRFKNSTEAISNTLRDRGINKGRIGIEGRGIPWSACENLKQGLRDYSLIDAGDIFERLRMIKTSEEVSIIKEAVKITEETLAELLKAARIGSTEWDIVSTVRNEATKRGCHTNFFDIEGGMRSSYPGFPTNNVLRSGDLLKIDYGITYRNYSTDIGRQAVVGQPDKEQKRIYDAILKAFTETIDDIKAGIGVSELFRLGVKKVRDAGIPSYQRQHIGHGNGIKAHEEPTLGPNINYPLESGMVLCVELPFHRVGWGGIALEDTVLVKDNGCEIFNKSSRDLYII
jgi:Xaa-Pro aminopeptidase